MTDKKALLSNSAYDALVKIVQYVLPAFGALYAALALVWGFGYSDQIVGTCAALATFGGVILGLSKRSYKKSGAKYDGDLVIADKPGSADEHIVRGIEGDMPLKNLVAKGDATLRIVKK